MVARKKTLTIPSLWKNDHRCGLYCIHWRVNFRKVGPGFEETQSEFPGRSYPCYRCKTELNRLWKQWRSNFLCSEGNRCMVVGSHSGLLSIINPALRVAPMPRVAQAMPRGSGASSSTDTLNLPPPSFQALDIWSFWVRLSFVNRIILLQLKM